MVCEKRAAPHNTYAKLCRAAPVRQRTEPNIWGVTRDQLRDLGGDSRVSMLHIAAPLARYVCPNVLEVTASPLIASYCAIHTSVALVRDCLNGSTYVLCVLPEDIRS